MNTNKVLMGGLAGGVAFFFLGWIIYGMLLMNLMQSYCNSSMNRPESDFVWWAMILSCLLSGFFYAIIFSWANISGALAGAKAGAILGAMLAASMDLSFYAMTTMYNGVAGIFIDVIAAAVMTALGGAVIGWVMGRNKPAAA